MLINVLRQQALFRRVRALRQHRPWPDLVTGVAHWKEGRQTLCAVERQAPLVLALVNEHGLFLGYGEVADASKGHLTALGTWSLRRSDWSHLEFLPRLVPTDESAAMEAIARARQGRPPLAVVAWATLAGRLAIWANGLDWRDAPEPPVLLVGLLDEQRQCVGYLEQADRLRGDARARDRAWILHLDMDTAHHALLGQQHVDPMDLDEPPSAAGPFNAAPDMSAAGPFNVAPDLSAVGPAGRPVSQDDFELAVADYVSVLHDAALAVALGVREVLVFARRWATLDVMRDTQLRAGTLAWMTLVAHTWPADARKHWLALERKIVSIWGMARDAHGRVVVDTFTMLCAVQDVHGHAGAMIKGVLALEPGGMVRITSDMYECTVRPWEHEQRLAANLQRLAVHIHMHEAAVHMDIQREAAREASPYLYALLERAPPPMLSGRPMHTDRRVDAAVLASGQPEWRQTLQTVVENARLLEKESRFTKSRELPAIAGDIEDLPLPPCLVKVREEASKPGGHLKHMTRFRTAAYFRALGHRDAHRLFVLLFGRVPGRGVKDPKILEDLVRVATLEKPLYVLSCDKLARRPKPPPGECLACPYVKKHGASGARAQCAREHGLAATDFHSPAEWMVVMSKKKK